MKGGEKISVSDGMRRAGGAALLTARGDLFELLSEQSAQEIAVEVYAAMVSRSLEDESKGRDEPHTTPRHSDRQ